MPLSRQEECAGLKICWGSDLLTGTRPTNRCKRSYSAFYVLPRICSTSSPRIKWVAYGLGKYASMSCHAVFNKKIVETTSSSLQVEKNNIANFTSRLDQAKRKGDTNSWLVCLVATECWWAAQMLSKILWSQYRISRHLSSCVPARKAQQHYFRSRTFTKEDENTLASSKDVSLLKLVGQKWNASFAYININNDFLVIAVIYALLFIILIN